MTTEIAHTSAIQSKKVIGTNVSDMAGTKIGVIEDIVFDKKNRQDHFRCGWIWRRDGHG